MMTQNDYIKILQYYQLPIPSSKANVKQVAEDILSLKLCKCIKKVSTTNEPKAIGICSRTIFNRKGLTRGSFKCKTRRFVKFDKTKKNRKATKTISRK